MVQRVVPRPLTPTPSSHTRGPHPPQWTTRLTCNLSHPWLDMNYGAPAPLETMMDQPARAGLEKPWA